MDNINVKNIFNAKHVGDKNRPLDIHTLINPDETHRKNRIKFSVDELIQIRENKRKEIISKYKKYLHICLEKIRRANKHNKIDIIYNVPHILIRFPNYNSIECLDYIEKRLRYLHMDTTRLSNTHIFVTWFNIEENKNNKN